METRAQPPRRLVLAVALVAAAMLLLELIVTRVFSVLFLYHYSFFAISLVMSGLTLGGLVATRLGARSLPLADFQARLAGLAAAFSAGVLLPLLLVTMKDARDLEQSPDAGAVLPLALAFVPGLVAAGAFLAAAFARQEEWIGRLYAADMGAASLACLLAIVVLRSLQGPAALLAPVSLSALAAVLLGGRRARAAGLLLAALAAAGMWEHLDTEGRFLRLPTQIPTLLERWNEHSRVIVGLGPGQDRYIVIDHSAVTEIPPVRPRASGQAIPAEWWWDAGVTNVAYRLGRPLRRAAIIGVGGGRDVLAALAHGAHVDGYEVNGVIADLMTRELTSLNPVALWPEVSLRHLEGRVGIARSGERYDVIQASLVDTWAATSAGGFVLSENGLYTLEAWRTFLASLSDGGVLTMTRWYVPGAPAEVHRLLALAMASLLDAGVQDPASHVVMLAQGAPADEHAQQHVRATILVSRSAFSAAEYRSIDVMCARDGMHLLAGSELAADPIMAALLDPARFAEAVAADRYDIAPPTDLKPYFFLQLRPRDVLRPPGASYDITFGPVRVMMMLVAVAWAFTLLVLVVAGRVLPRREKDAGARRLHRLMSLYFVGIGFGYIAVQLALHQRLILVLGQPTLALSVVLGAMLLGTGAGALLSQRLVTPRSFGLAWTAIALTVLGLVLGLPAGSSLERVLSVGGRSAITALVVGLAALPLGLAFPIGVRLVGPAGEGAVPRMWAFNGAASIAGSTTAAMLGVMLGSRAVMLAGLVAYLAAALAGVVALRDRAPAVAQARGLGA